MQKIIVITGQTATGKTSYALKLAKKINGELINADSRQIYKHMDIITGKDVSQNDQFLLYSHSEIREQKRYIAIGYYVIDTIQIWLYDAIDPMEPFSSYDFKICTGKVIDDIISRGKVPIIIGGAYLYIKHLLYGVETENIPPDLALRKQLKNKTAKELFDMLRSINAQMSRQLNISDKKNPQRLIRKIEIAKMSNTLKESKSFENERRYNIQQFIGLKFKTRDRLVAAITKRVGDRIKKGAIKEVKRLLQIGYTKHDPGLQTIGYKQIISYLQDEITLDEAVQQWITKEVQYARRQYTFMKQNKHISWIQV